MLDKAMLNLFKLRCHTEIGMPAWAVRELISRKSHALTPDDIVGRSERYQGRSMLEEHGRGEPRVQPLPLVILLPI